ncbi:hypothetical protein DL766_006303 [Monosporascus sp. MC13-8B]|uniref:Enoyl reductase (ER) domain-containing protein n=1 Tax=Monosporascus cannonballus TaxID=155416 RepID=A0ABY0H732_9PEZI|nr:hypothetical protein DL762_004677 [Monosporascus cannonballus]RYO98510.1 hypothetical protein DL763_002162 [Monosporascus cannonballus]RYP27577.1 hypothetical protein DL766_006303 [Monosporascus sp. MC13-8B]
MAPSTMKALISVEAQNPTDWKAMAHVPPGRTIGCDFAGTVEDSNGSHWREGQRIAGFVQGTTPSPPRGAFAEYADAAVVPLAFATAVQALFQRLKLPEPSKPAKSTFPVLINGGTSSVGHYAVQLCRLAGAFVVATGSKKNHELLKSLGADATVDYKDTDWPEQVRKVTHDGLEYAFDCIVEKGSPQQIAKALSPTKGGHIVTILPVVDTKDEVRQLNSKAKLESTIVYTVFERPLRYGAFENCGEATPEDKAIWEKYLAILPEILTKGKIKPNRVREMGGIEDILTGFREQKEGRVSAEKLVYKIA